MLKPSLFVFSLLMSAFALGQTPPAAISAAPAAQLKALFAASDEAHLKRNPLEALFRGDQRYADQFGDYIRRLFRRRKAGGRG
jgi:hypothetical protein